MNVEDDGGFGEGQLEKGDEEDVSCGDDDYDGVFESDSSMTSANMCFHVGKVANVSVKREGDCVGTW